MALSLLVSNALVFPRAGSFKLEKLLADGSPSKYPEDIYTAGQSAVGVINAGWSSSTEELHDQNDKNPRAVYVTGTKETISIEMHTEDPYLDLYLKGGKIESKTNGVQEYVDLPALIPQGGVLEISGPDGGAVALDDKTTILVRDVVTNEDYKAVTTDPQPGEYKVDAAGGEFIFSAADEGRRVYISAGYKVSGVTEFVRNKNASTPTYRLTINGPVNHYNTDGDDMWLTEIYPAVQLASGELATLARQLSVSSAITINFQNVASRSAEGSKRMFSALPAVAT